MLTLSHSAVFAATAATVRAYTWPSPQIDALETARFDAHTGVLLPGVQPCNHFQLEANTGRSNAADWVRAAYHDMATHNIADGTGGLDASIRFDEERLRPEAPLFQFFLSVAFSLVKSLLFIFLS
ncbi:hypothetical protein R3P38DRAFT_3468987 [Favolaschia claudopus]|uniref:Uncharacterized protein n=1 Tax=Favolaschia claudopus TaxID=2862362 RepID=A0AAW0CM93_9AGAR